jgi:hypothetical protein
MSNIITEYYYTVIIQSFSRTVQYNDCGINSSNSP